MINFYYDKIFKNWPLPNGALNKKYFFQKYCGYQLPPGYPVQSFNYFYFLAKKNNIAPILFTGDQFADNLYYPIEMRANGDIPIVENIPKKSLKRLKKGKMKLLLICFGATGYEQYSLIKAQIDKFKEYGVKDITVVTDELNGVFRKYLDVKLLSFDYSQVLAQQILRSSKNTWLTKEKLHKYTDFDVDSFSPTELYYSYQPHHIMHKISLIAELDYRNLPLSFNNIAGPTYNYNDPIIYDKWRSNSENDLLKPFLEKYINNNIDHVDNFEQHTNSFITVHNQNNTGTGNVLPEELHSLHTDVLTWFYIAMGKPFIVFGSYNIMAYLNNEGYFTFGNVINEAYDRCSNIPQRASLIADELERINTDLQSSISTYNEFIKLYKSNRIKFLSKDHLSRFINLYDSIQFR